MKISSVPSINNLSPGTDPQAQRIDALRTLKMNVNRTPGLELPPEASALVEGEVAPVEDKAIEEPKPPEVTEPLSPQFAALAKQRRALQVKERELVDREKALELKSQGSDVVPLARLKSEPLSVLLESGVTYDQLTEAILANQKNPDIRRLEDEIKTLKEGVDKRLTDGEQQARQQVLTEMRREADRLVLDRADDFELVRETKSVGKVIELIERNYDETGEVLDVTEALKLVEDQLLERHQSLIKLKKLQSLVQPAPQPVQPHQKPVMRTLTNKDTASVPMDRRARALGAFNGTLKR